MSCENAKASIFLNDFWGVCILLTATCSKFLLLTHLSQLLSLFSSVFPVLPLTFLKELLLYIITFYWELSISEVKEINFNFNFRHHGPNIPQPPQPGISHGSSVSLGCNFCQSTSLLVSTETLLLSPPLFLASHTQVDRIQHLKSCYLILRRK